RASPRQSRISATSAPRSPRSSARSTRTALAAEPHHRMSKPIAGISMDQASASAQAQAAELVGRVLVDRYRIDSLLAFGGMAVIYRGEHVHTRKDVAIKVLHPETEGFPELVARFEREAIACSRINHPNVVSVIDFGRFDEGSFFLVLEYLAGETLRDLMHQ